MSEGALRHLDGALEDLRRAGLLRVDSGPAQACGKVLLCTNDYLGYAAEPLGTPAAPAGAGASRLIHGDHEAHRVAEAALASWVGAEAALLFSSGYAANVGTIAALAGRGDVIISDELNHASIIDGCRLSRAQVVVVPHRDVSAIAQALTAARGASHRWVVTESYFSMDGDTADLARLRQLCDANDAALVVDEAHALGVFGPRGAGLCADSGVVPDVLVGTLGKALGLQGAFVAGTRALRSWLWNRARSFVFSTGVSPVLAEIVAGRVARVADDSERRASLFAVVEALRAELAAAGAHLPERAGPILPWVFGPADATLRAAARLSEAGVIVQAIRPPTVPVGGSRLRFTASAAITPGDLEVVARALRSFT